MDGRLLQLADGLQDALAPVDTGSIQGLFESLKMVQQNLNEILKSTLLVLAKMLEQCCEYQ